MQRPADLAPRALAIQFFGFLQRVGIDGDRGMQLGVVESNPRQILLNQVPRRKAFLLHRLLHFRDRHFNDRKRPPLPAGCDYGEAEQNRDIDGASVHR